MCWSLERHCFHSTANMWFLCTSTVVFLIIYRYVERKRHNFHTCVFLETTDNKVLICICLLFQRMRDISHHYMYLFHTLPFCFWCFYFYNVPKHRHYCPFVSSQTSYTFLFHRMCWSLRRSCFTSSANMCFLSTYTVAFLVISLFVTRIRKHCHV